MHLRSEWLREVQHLTHVFRKPHPCVSMGNLQIVLVTDPKMGDLRDALNYIYSNIYVEYVVKNPLYTPGQPFRCSGRKLPSIAICTHLAFTESAQSHCKVFAL